MDITKEILREVFTQSSFDPNMFLFQDGRFNLGSDYANGYMCIIRNDQPWYIGPNQDYWEDGFRFTTIEELAEFFLEQSRKLKLKSLEVIANRLYKIAKQQ